MSKTVKEHKESYAFLREHYWQLLQELDSKKRVYVPSVLKSMEAYRRQRVEDMREEIEQVIYESYPMEMDNDMAFSMAKSKADKLIHKLLKTD